MFDTGKDAHLLTQAGLRMCVYTLTHIHTHKHALSSAHTHTHGSRSAQITGVSHLVVDQKEIKQERDRGKDGHSRNSERLADGLAEESLQ